MPTLNQIAENPRKALVDLEKELGVAPGSLLLDMTEVTREGDWTEHLPYGAAAIYYQNDAVQQQYQTHVEGCSYCKRLLETLHPSDLQAHHFARIAANAQPLPEKRSGLALYGLAASIFAAAIAVTFHDRIGSMIPAATIDIDNEKITAIDELRTEPSMLLRWERSSVPLDRYRAARMYFAADKPQLAWQQIGRGLELAGVSPADAQRIVTASDVPSGKSAQTLSMAAQQLTHLKTDSRKRPATEYLEAAEVQAKLGSHGKALKSIEGYLKATRTDPRIVEEFAEAAVVASPAWIVE